MRPLPMIALALIGCERDPSEHDPICPAGGELIETDEDADGVIDSRIASFATDEDSYGNPLRRESDDNADGSTEFVTTYDYTYDDDGSVLYSESISHRVSDPTVGYFYRTSTFDAEGALMAWEHDMDVDGVFEERGWNTYDETGLLVREESTSDGRPEYDWIATSTATYGADGYPVTVTRDVDQGSDGTLDDESVGTYTRNADGTPIRIRYTWDEGLDGILEFTATVEYEDGEMVSFEADTDLDGTVDFRELYRRC